AAHFTLQGGNGVGKNNRAGRTAGGGEIGAFEVKIQFLAYLVTDRTAHAGLAEIVVVAREIGAELRRGDGVIEFSDCSARAGGFAKRVERAAFEGRLILGLLQSAPTFRDDVDHAADRV